MSLIMPKGDGTLAALEGSLRVYNRDYPYTVNNEKFKKEISKELNLGDGRDGPFLIKKSETARYFGLISYDFTLKSGFITERGRKYLYARNSYEKFDLIFESILADSFGRMNCASKGSNAELDPPKLLLKSIIELNGISKHLFVRLVYLINDCNYKFNDVIDNLYKHGDTILPPLLYNKYNDMKFLVFLKNIKMIIEDNNLLQLSPRYFDSNKIKKIEEISIFNRSPNASISLGEYEKDQEPIAVYNPKILEAINNRIPESFITSQLTKYKTNPRIKKTVIKNSNYQCQVNFNHTTFTNRKGHKYMEGHHLIPMNAQSNISINIDRAENIISLCPTCHRAIHYGDEGVKRHILWILYQNNINSLINVGLNISFDTLLSYY